MDMDIDIDVEDIDGRIQQVDPPQGTTIYTIGVLESRIGGWIFPGVWVGVPSNKARQVLRCLPLFSGGGSCSVSWVGLTGFSQPSSTQHESPTRNRAFEKFGQDLAWLSLALCRCWLAVKELKISYHNSKTILFTMYP